MMFFKCRINSLKDSKSVKSSPDLHIHCVTYLISFVDLMFDKTCQINNAEADLLLVEISMQSMRIVICVNAFQ
jgi:hypothetical protein